MPAEPVDPSTLPIPPNILALSEFTAAQADGERETVSAALVRIGNATELFHDDNQQTFMTAYVNGKPETWSLKSSGAREYLSRTYYDQTRKVPGSQAIHDAMNVIHGKALHEGPERATDVRIARNGGKIYLDLADASRTVVEIRPGSWSCISDPPVRFRRPRGMLALPLPRPGGNLDELRRFVNVSGVSSWRLVMTWLVALFFKGPYTWLALQGRQGSSKSCTSRFLRQVVDPNKAPVRAPPKSTRDLIISALNSAVLVLDNVSFIDEDLSDSLCRLSTGSGLSGRELYSDLEEVIVQVQRAGILNGITDIIARGDLLDRCILLVLPPMASGARRPEKTLDAEFAEAWPRILGAVLDVVAAVCEHLPLVSIEDPPRMADFAHVGVALERAAGWPAASFLSAYEEALTAATDVAIDASVIAPSIIRIADSGGFEGTATEVLERINDVFDDRIPQGRFGQMPMAQRNRARPEGWPKSPRALSAQLRRLEPSLLAKRIAVTFTQTFGEGSKKVITILKLDHGRPLAFPAAAASNPAQASEPGSRSDAPSAPVPGVTEMRTPRAQTR